jgi:hypothetical protein
MTQIDFIMDKLKQDGEISRNYCLRNYISRLGARINDLKKIGFEFETENRDGDYVYKLKVKDTLF